MDMNIISRLQNGDETVPMCPEEVEGIEEMQGCDSRGIQRRGSKSKSKNGRNTTRFTDNMYIVQVHAHSAVSIVLIGADTVR